MVTAGFVAPYLLDTTTRFVEAAARLPGVRLALITCEPADRLPSALSESLAGHWRIEDPLDPGQIAAAVQGLGRQLGEVLVENICQYHPRPLLTKMHEWISPITMALRDLDEPGLQGGRELGAAELHLYAG
jgi:hypothetical protein